MPLVRWMKNELKDLVQSLLLDRRTLQRGYFDEQGIRKLWDDFLAGRAEDHLPIWRLMMLELWHREFLEPFQRAHAGRHLYCVA